MPRALRSPKLLATLAAAAAAAAVVGSQAGGGTAGAATPSSAAAAPTGTTGATGARRASGAHRAGGGHRAAIRALLGDAARELGVPEAELRTALRGLRPLVRRAKAERRAALVSALATATGATQGEVTAALRDRRRDGGRGPAALARALGTTEARVREGRRAFRAGEAGRRAALRDRLVTRVAADLGVPEAKVAEVAARLLPAHGRNAFRRP